MRCLYFSIGILCTASAGSVSREDDKRAFPIFSIVKFANDNCDAGNDRTGTCYTREECDSRGGNAGSSCAEGFGICCEFRLVGDSKCGQTVAQNSTYLVEEGRTATGMCNYEICPCSNDICRIRFDFTELDLSKPTSFDTVAGGNAAAVGKGESIGQCATDTFMITGAGATGSPVICGPNKGQHMILDNDGKTCHNVNINMGTGTTSRKWDIVVTQYNCNNNDNLAAGPSGCLQYFHDPTLSGNGWLVNYGANAIAQEPDQAVGAPADIADDATHLANQNYNICIRRIKANCRICYEAQTGGDATGDQSGFGVSNAMDAAAKSVVDAGCTADFLAIPVAQLVAQAGVLNSVNKVCGRFLNTADNVAANVKLCSRGLPFRVGVTFDNGESITIAGAAKTDETAVFPGGIVGFRLRYEQTAASCA